MDFFGQVESHLGFPVTPVLFEVKNRQLVSLKGPQDPPPKSIHFQHGERHENKKSNFLRRTVGVQYVNP